MVINREGEENQRRRDGGAEKKDNTTRLQQPALPEGACEAVDGLCQTRCLRDQEQMMPQGDVTACASWPRPTGLRWPWHRAGSRGGQDSTSLPEDARLSLDRWASAFELRLLLRHGEPVCKNLWIRFISSSKLLQMCPFLSVQTSVWKTVWNYIYKTKNTVPGTMRCKLVVWTMGWQFHLDRCFNIAGALLKYWFCTSIKRGFYNCLIIVTLMKSNKQAQFSFPFHVSLIWFPITSQSSYGCKFKINRLLTHVVPENITIQSEMTNTAIRTYYLRNSTHGFFQHPCSVVHKNNHIWSNESN